MHWAGFVWEGVRGFRPQQIAGGHQTDGPPVSKYLKSQLKVEIEVLKRLKHNNIVMKCSLVRPWKVVDERDLFNNIMKKLLNFPKKISKLTEEHLNEDAGDRGKR